MLDNRLLRLSFLISTTCHLLLVGFYFPHNLKIPGIKEPKELIIQAVSLLPEIEVMGDEKKLKETAEKLETLAPEPETEEIVAEESIKESEPFAEQIKVVNPAEEAMLRYQDLVKQKIEEKRRYPVWAKRQGREGQTQIEFKIIGDGRVRQIRQVDSSGCQVLDEEAIAMIKRASPFLPIPGEINRDSVSFDLTIVFKLN